MYVGVQQIVDSFVNLPAVLLPLGMLVATLDATSVREWFAGRFLAGRLPSSRVPPVAPLAALALGVAGALAMLAWSESIAARNDAALAAFKRGENALAAELAASVAAADPTVGAYQVNRGLTADRAGLTTAREAFRAGAERDDLAESWLDVAALAAAAGDRDDAAFALGRALRLGHQRVNVAFAAGTVWLELGDLEAAREAFVSAVVAFPSLATDPHWESSPELHAMRPSVVAAALDQGSAIAAWELALLTRDPSEPERRTRLAAADRAAADLVVPAWAVDAPARTALAALAVSDPDSIFVLGWCARDRRPAR